MINLMDKTALDNHFAEDAKTLLFPVLAHHLMAEGDLEHARGVCEIGLEHHPDNLDGLFLLAKVEWQEQNIHQAEALLKKVTRQNTVHVNALYQLLEVQIMLGRSANTLKKILGSLIKIFPNDEQLQNQFENPESLVQEPALTISDQMDELSELSEASDEFDRPEREPLPDIDFTPIDSGDLSEQLEMIESNAPEVEPPEPAIEPPAAVTEPESIPEPEPEPTPAPTQSKLSISSRMATFTLAQVFKKQQNYIQALEILKLLEEKGDDPARIEKERTEINQLLKQQEEEE